MNTKNTKMGRKRRFSTGDLLIDEFYEKANKQLYDHFFDKSNHYLSQFEYHYDENKDEHTAIVYGNASRGGFYKFKKNKNGIKYFCSDRHQGNNNNNNKKDIEFLNVRMNSVDIMWPISLSQRNILSRHINNRQTISVMISRLKVNFIAHHSEISKDKEKQNKLTKAEMVLNKKWKKIDRTLITINYKYFIKKWWKNFVDKKKFKAILSVIGTSVESPISFDNFIHFSSHIDNDIIVENIKRLGNERVLLKKIPLNKWKDIKTEDLLPNVWVKQWHNVSKYPFTIRQEIARFIEKNILTTEGDQTLCYQPSLTIYPSQNILEMNPDFSNKKQKFDPSMTFWKIFSQYAKNLNKKETSPRKLHMGLLASMASVDRICSNQNPDDIEQNSFLLSEDKMNQIADYIYKFSNIWLDCNRDDYRRWGYSHKECWIHECNEIVAKSFKKGEFTIPKITIHINNDKLKSYRSIYEKNILKEHITSNLNKSVIQKRKRTRMM